MTVINESHRIAGEEISASLLIWRRLRLPAPGMIEALLTANRGLADLGQHIPLDTDVAIPIDTDARYGAPAEIALWDET